MAMSTSSSDDPLRGVYRQIAHKAAHETPDWPASHAFCRLLHQQQQSPETTTSLAPGICTIKYQTPEFRDGRGPFGLVALLTDQHNPTVQPLLQRCLDAFDGLVHELVALDPSATLHVIPRTLVPHICIFLVHEHPSFLSSQQVHDGEWQHVDDNAMQGLVDDLGSVIQQRRAVKDQLPVTLELDSIVLTPDGAMVAGFVDATAGDDNNNAYQGLKSDCVQVMKDRLGQLTSRPKNLIHATLGRVLGFESPQNCSGDDVGDRQDRIVQLVRRYNEQVLPRLVQEMPDRTWTLRHVSMLRNTVWFCEENVIYHTWDLGQHQVNR